MFLKEQFDYVLLCLPLYQHFLFMTHHLIRTNASVKILVKKQTIHMNHKPSFLSKIKKKKKKIECYLLLL